MNTANASLSPGTQAASPRPGRGMIPLPPIPGITAPAGAPGTDHWQEALLAWIILSAGQAAGPHAEAVQKLLTQAFASTSLGDEVVSQAVEHLLSPPASLAAPGAVQVAQKVAADLQKEAAATGHGNLEAASAVLSGAASGASMGAAAGPAGMAAGAGIGALTGLASTPEGQHLAARVEQAGKSAAKDVIHFFERL